MCTASPEQFPVPTTNKNGISSNGINNTFQNSCGINTDKKSPPSKFAVKSKFPVHEDTTDAPIFVNARYKIGHHDILEEHVTAEKTKSSINLNNTSTKKNLPSSKIAVVTLRSCANQSSKVHGKTSKECIKNNRGKVIKKEQKRKILKMLPKDNQSTTEKDSEVKLNFKQKITSSQHPAKFRQDSTTKIVSEPHQMKNEIKFYEGNSPIGTEFRSWIRILGSLTAKNQSSKSQVEFDRLEQTIEDNEKFKLQFKSFESDFTSAPTRCLSDSEEQRFSDVIKYQPCPILNHSFEDNSDMYPECRDPVQTVPYAPY